MTENSLSLLAQAQNDLIEDLDELLYLFEDIALKLATFLRDISKVKKHIFHTTYTSTTQTGEQYQKELISQLEIVQLAKKRVSTKTITVSRISEVTELCNNAREYLRTHAGIIAALITSTDWQSPSFAHSLHSQAGRQTHSIYPTINDYKRDQHWDAYHYEQAYKKAYVDTIMKFPIHVDLTSSGMAAFTTIVMFLLAEKKTERGIVVGASTYFQNMRLITDLFPKKRTIVTEQNTQEILRVVDAKTPSVIFLDSLTNAQHICIPDIQAIISHLVKSVTDETYIVIDNTSLSVLLQPFKQVVWKRSKLRLILFESLNKYHQFGMDRTTAGMIVSYGKHTEKIFDYRVNAGTIIPDTSAVILPTPNRKQLTQRLTRHNRNATILARRMQTWIDAHPASMIEKINYPGLPNHPAYEHAKTVGFAGSYFTIVFRERAKSVRTYKRFVAHALKIAKKSGVDLVSGTSFGLTTTRIYLTAMRSRPNEPFIRIAVGCEHALSIDTISDVLIQTLEGF